MRNKNGEIIDYYKVLNIESTATDDEIKKAYQARMRALHPDKTSGNSNKDINEEITRVADAKKILLNEDSSINRAAYDKMLKPRVTQEQKSKVPQRPTPQYSESEIKAQKKVQFIKGKLNLVGSKLIDEKQKIARNSKIDLTKKLEEIERIESEFLSSLKSKEGQWKKTAEEFKKAKNSGNDWHYYHEPDDKTDARAMKLYTFYVAYGALLELMKSIREVIEFEKKIAPEKFALFDEKIKKFDYEQSDVKSAVSILESNVEIFCLEYPAKQEAVISGQKRLLEKIEKAETSAKKVGIPFFGMQDVAKSFNKLHDQLKGIFPLIPIQKSEEKPRPSKT